MLFMGLGRPRRRGATRGDRPGLRIAELGAAVSRAVPDVSFGDIADLTSTVVLLLPRGPGVIQVT